jgi:predicted Zn-dependent protease
VLAFAAATHAPGAVAAAGDRFVPTDPAFVVANIERFVPDGELRPLLEAWQADRQSSAIAVALAHAFIDRARRLREPAYFGRAEAVLSPLVKLPRSGHAPRRLYATVLQFRHEFAAAEELLDGVLRDNPRDLSARTLRASIRLVRGDFAGARGDCAQLAGGGEMQVGLVCLAEALAGSGDLDRALGLLASGAPAARDAGYLLAVRGELRERAGDAEGAITDYRAALDATPGDDSIRAALADALADSGRAGEAFRVLDVDRPSLALVVRQAIVAPPGRRKGCEARASEWLGLEGARGDAIHFREAALLALSRGDPVRALEAARANFENQRELADVRVFARAAAATRDAAALARIEQWLSATGFRDVVTETVLRSSPRG